MYRGEKKEAAEKNTNEKFLLSTVKKFFICVFFCSFFLFSSVHKNKKDDER
jgi:hypothetical protein